MVFAKACPLTYDILQVVAYLSSHRDRHLVFASFMEIFKSGSLIQDLIPRVTVNENRISIAKRTSGCRKTERNQIFKIEDVSIVRWLAKHFAFCFSLAQ